jgi:hypothetical protein
VILSKAFFSKSKTWTPRELSALTAIEDATGESRILPLWHHLNKSEVTAFSPTVSSLAALETHGMSLDDIVVRIKAKIGG